MRNELRSGSNWRNWHLANLYLLVTSRVVGAERQAVQRRIHQLPSDWLGDYCNGRDQKLSTVALSALIRCGTPFPSGAITIWRAAAFTRRKIPFGHSLFIDIFCFYRLILIICFEHNYICLCFIWLMIATCCFSTVVVNYWLLHTKHSVWLIAHSICSTYDFQKMIIFNS